MFQAKQSTFTDSSFDANQKRTSRSHGEGVIGANNLTNAFPSLFMATLSSLLLLALTL